MIKIKAVERKVMVGPMAGQYRWIMTPEVYSTLSDKKVIAQAAATSGVSRGILQAAWEAIGAVIQTWATEGHSVAIPGLGTMRFGLNAASVANVNEVASSLITTRKVVFTPNVDIKQELKNTSVQITCIDRNGDVVKRVTSSDPGNVDDPETPGSDNQGGSTQTPGGGSDNQGGGTQTPGGGSDNQGGGTQTPGDNTEDIPEFV